VSKTLWHGWCTPRSTLIPWRLFVTKLFLLFIVTSNVWDAGSFLHEKPGTSRVHAQMTQNSVAIGGSKLCDGYGSHVFHWSCGISHVPSYPQAFLPHNGLFCLAENEKNGWKDGSESVALILSWRQNVQQHSPHPVNCVLAHQKKLLPKGSRDCLIKPLQQPSRLDLCKIQHWQKNEQVDIFFIWGYLLGTALFSNVMWLVPVIGSTH